DLLSRVDNNDFALRLEPALDPRLGIRDDGCAAGGELEQPCGRGAFHGRMRSPSDVEINAACRYRAGEAVERDPANPLGRTKLPPKITAPDSEPKGAKRPAWLGDEPVHPFLPELVPVSVEEDVERLLLGLRREEVGVCPPEERLHPDGAKL